MNLQSSIDADHPNPISTQRKNATMWKVWRALKANAITLPTFVFLFSRLSDPPLPKTFKNSQSLVFNGIETLLADGVLRFSSVEGYLHNSKCCSRPQGKDGRDHILRNFQATIAVITRNLTISPTCFANIS